MAKLKSVQLKCNGCTAVRVSKPSAMPKSTLRKLRHDLRSVGWDCDDFTDTDLCPTCTGKRRLALSEGEVPA